MAKRRTLIANGFALLVLCGAALVILPLTILWPFRAQTPLGLTLALSIRTVGPILGPLLALAALLCAFRLWPQSGRWQRALVVIGLIISFTSAALSRVNYFQRIFAPITSPQIQSAEQAKLDPDDMVLVVRLQEHSRAYPIRELAYHHLVNDTLDGVSLVATY